MNYLEQIDIWQPIETQPIYKLLDAIIITDVTHLKLGETLGKLAVDYVLIGKDFEFISNHREEFDFHIQIKEKYEIPSVRFMVWVNQQIKDIKQDRIENVNGEETDYIKGERMYITLENKDTLNTFLTDLQKTYYSEVKTHIKAVEFKDINALYEEDKIKHQPIIESTKATDLFNDLASDFEFEKEEDVVFDETPIKTNKKLELTYDLKEDVFNTVPILFNKQYKNSILTVVTDYDVKSPEIISTDNNVSAVFEFDTYVDVSVDYLMFTKDFKKIKATKLFHLHLPDNSYTSQKEIEDEAESILNNIEKVFKDTKLYDENLIPCIITTQNKKFLFHAKSEKYLTELINHILKGNKENKAKKKPISIEQVLTAKVSKILVIGENRIKAIQEREKEMGLDLTHYGFKEKIMSVPISIYLIKHNNTKIYLSYYFGYIETLDEQQNTVAIQKFYDYFSTTENINVTIPTIVQMFVKFSSLDNAKKKELAVILDSLLNRNKKLVKLPKAK